MDNLITPLRWDVLQAVAGELQNPSHNSLGLCGLTSQTMFHVQGFSFVGFSNQWKFDIYLTMQD